MINWNDKIYHIEDFYGKEIFKISCGINFSTLDGHTKFMMVASNYIQQMTKSRGVRQYLDIINQMFTKLVDCNVKYDKETDFKDYCERVSKLLELETDYEMIEKTAGKFTKLEDSKTEDRFLIIMRDSDYDEDVKKEDITFEEYVKGVLKEQCNLVTLTNSTERNMFISKYGCHIEVIVAIQILRSTMIYLFNCYSNEYYDKLMEYDYNKVSGNIAYAEAVIKNIKNLY